MLNLNFFQVVNNPALVAIGLYNAILTAIANGDSSVEISFNTGEGGVFHNYVLPLKIDTGEPVFAEFQLASYQKEVIDPVSQKLDREILIKAYEDGEVGVWLRTRARLETFMILTKPDLMSLLSMADQLRKVGMDLYSAADAAVVDRFLDT